MQPYNPYAPPDPFRNAQPPPYDPSMQVFTVTREALEAARVRLDAFLADPVNVAAETQLRGSRFRRVTFVMAALAFALLAGGGVGLAVTDGHWAAITLLVVGGVFALIAVVSVILDLTVPARDRPGTPESCLKGYITGLRFGRSGYVVTCLAPTARMHVVPAPNLMPMVTGTGASTLDTAASMKAYAKTFATQGHGQMRLFTAKKYTVISNDGTFAQVEAQMQMYSWPAWVTYVSIAVMAAIRFLGIIVYAALYYSMRKGGARVVRKWAIRGSDGVFYLFDGDITGP